jgi:cytochrome P450
VSSTRPEAIDLSKYDPMEREVQQNPFPYYAALRAQDPVFRHPATGIFFISRHATVSRVLGEPLLFSSQFANMAASGSGGASDELRAIAREGYPQVNTMLTADPPAQTRYRKTVGRAFSSRRILALEPTVRAVANELIDAWPQEGRVDFMNSFAVMLPVRVIAEALNMKPEVVLHIKRWSDDSVAALGVAISDERRIEAARGVLEMQKYWAEEFIERRERPREDFLTALAQAEFEDETGTTRLLEIPELISIIQQLMVAGNETTTKLINEGVRLLIENPEEWERIRKDPEAVPAMVEEALRMSSPNQGLFRLVTQDTELEGAKIPKGSLLWVMFGSANRDERLFPDPDRFDPSRENLREHLAFGKGAHFCIGAPLARLEARVAFEQLAARIDRWRIPADFALEYEPSYILRGLSALDLELART